MTEPRAVIGRRRHKKGSGRSEERDREGEIQTKLLIFFRSDRADHRELAPGQAPGMLERRRRLRSKRGRVQKPSMVPAASMRGAFS